MGFSYIINYSSEDAPIMASKIVPEDRLLDEAMKIVQEGFIIYFIGRF